MTLHPGDAPDAKVRVVIADDDALVRQGLGLILGGSGPVEIVGEAEDGLAVEAVIDEHSPDVVLMDIRMPRRDGIATTRALTARVGSPRVLVLTTFDDDELVLDAMRAGASGFLLKSTRPAQMVEGILAVARGESTFTPSVMETLIKAATREDDTAHQSSLAATLDVLTEREREVAFAVAQGLSNAQIASSLYMSVATVKAHISKIFEKLGLENRVQIAVRIYEAGLNPR